MRWRLALGLAMLLGWPVLCWPFLSPFFQDTSVTAPGPPAGLAIHLPLAGDYADISGNNNPGIPSGSPVFGSATWGTALNCDGVDDLVTIAADPSFANLSAYTLAACITPTTYGETGFGRIAEVETSPSVEGIRFNLASGSTNFIGSERRYSTTIGRYEAPVGSILTTNTYHVAYSYADATKIGQLYIDGQPVTTTETNTPAGTFDPTSGAAFVCNRAGQDRTFDGFVGHFRLYTQVQSNATIAAVAASDCPS